MTELQAEFFILLNTFYPDRIFQKIQKEISKMKKFRKNENPVFENNGSKQCDLRKSAG
jgi:hypothetical protein